MKRIAWIWMALCYLGIAWAGDIERISITYDYISENWADTPEQAEQNAILSAQTKALEEHFGLDVVGMTSMLQSERVEKDDIAYSESFIKLSDVSVRGEWIQTLEQRILDKTFENGLWRVRVYIEGRARNHSTDLLKKLQDTAGDVTLQELGEYITKNVSQQSILLNGKSQTPCVTPSASLDASWREWKLK